MAVASNNNAFLRWDSQISAPWSSLSRRVYPRTVGEVFAWAEELWLHHGIYSAAIKKAIRYFMTELELTGGDEVDRDSRKKYLEALEENFDLMEEAATVGDDYIGFGNSFTSVTKPFIRSLVCPKCGFKAPLDKMKGHFKWEPPKFKGVCPAPSCRKQVTYTREDVQKPADSAKPVITRWPPQYMEIKHHPITKRKKFTLDTLQYDELIQGVMTEDSMFLEDTPWEIIEAVTSNRKFEFAEDEVYHMAYPPPSSLLPSVRGWGLPPFMNEFETALLVTMLDKYTEAILVDYLVPFRLFSLPPGNGQPETDPMLQLDAGRFMGQMTQMLARHRQNPAGYNFLPMPIEYQVLGGEAKDIVPIEIQEHYEARLLNSMGIPNEFYQGSFGNNAGPMLGFKMFEREWQHFADQLNKWLTWLVNKQGELQNWEKVSAKLSPMSVYEDPEIRDIKLQLSAAGEVSKRTAWKPLGLNPEVEQKLVLDEQDDAAEELEKRQKDQEARAANREVASTPSAGQQIIQEDEAALQAQQQQQGGGMPAPAGMPAPGGGVSMGNGPSMGATLDDLMLQADTMAQQIFYLDPLGRRQALGDLKSSNEALYAQVKAKISEMENQASTQGRQMARQGQLQPQ